MVAEVLQIPPDSVSMTPADSLVTPYEFGPVGSRGTYAIGSAVINAAEDARKKLSNLPPQTGCDPGGPRYGRRRGILRKAHPEKNMKWRAMGNDRTILGYGRFEPDFTMCNMHDDFCRGRGRHGDGQGEPDPGGECH